MQPTAELFLVFCVMSKLLPGSADVLVGFVLSDADLRVTSTFFSVPQLLNRLASDP